MKRMWLPAVTNVSCYTVDSVTIGNTDHWSTVSPGWVDVETYPLLEPYCITEQDYKLKRLMGEVSV